VGDHLFVRNQHKVEPCLGAGHCLYSDPRGRHPGSEMMREVNTDEDKRAEGKDMKDSFPHNLGRVFI